MLFVKAGFDRPGCALAKYAGSGRRIASITLAGRRRSGRAAPCATRTISRSAVADHRGGRPGFAEPWPPAIRSAGKGVFEWVEVRLGGRQSGRVTRTRAMAYWLMKTEPDDYSWEQLVEDGVASWDGVHNHQAARNMRAMKEGDRAFFYRSMEDPAVVGVMEIVREAYQDPNDPRRSFVLVDVGPVRRRARGQPGADQGRAAAAASRAGAPVAAFGQSGRRRGLAADLRDGRDRRLKPAAHSHTLWRRASTFASGAGRSREPARPFPATRPPDHLPRRSDARPRRARLQPWSTARFLLTGAAPALSGKQRGELVEDRLVDRALEGHDQAQHLDRARPAPADELRVDARRVDVGVAAGEAEREPLLALAAVSTAPAGGHSSGGRS